MYARNKYRDANYACEEEETMHFKIGKSCIHFSYPGPSQKERGPGTHCLRMLYFPSKHWEFGCLCIRPPRFSSVIYLYCKNYEATHL